MSITPPRIPASPQADAPRDARKPGHGETADNLVVETSDSGWLVTTVGGEPICVVPTKAEAVQLAREHASKAGASITVKREDGTVQDTFKPKAA